MTGWTRRKFLKIVAGSVSVTRIATSVEARSGFLPELRAGSIDESDAGEPFDVCIIGSGPAGSILACELVRHGVRTLLVEGGQVPGSPPRYKPADDSWGTEALPIFGQEVVLVFNRWISSGVIRTFQRMPPGP